MHDMNAIELHAPGNGRVTDRDLPLFFEQNG